MKFDEYRIFGLYCYNQINKENFRNLMNKSFNSDFDNLYITEKWEKFVSNPLLFIIDKKNLFEKIQQEIKSKNYKG